MTPKRIDAQALKSRLNIVDIVAQTVKLRRSGSNYVGLCPFHHNQRTPALAVFPATQTWRCFGACNDGGDVFAWVMKRDGLDFAAALAALDDGRAGPATPLPAVRAPEPAPAPPNETWQARAREFIAACQQRLENAPAVMRYLHEQRLLRKHTIQAAQIGFNPVGRKEPGKWWGLPREMGDVWLPAGIVIPGVVAGAVWYIKIRQPKGREPKYLHVKRPAQSAVLYHAEHCEQRRVVALTEGEFDCLLLHQECAVVAGVGTLGAQGNRLTDWLFRYLADADVVLAVYDTDGKSEKGLSALLNASAKVRRLALPNGKDVTEFAASGGDLFRWCLAERRQALAAQFADRAAHLAHVRAMLAKPLPIMLRVDYEGDLDDLVEACD